MKIKNYSKTFALMLPLAALFSCDNAGDGEGIKQEDYVKTMDYIPVALGTGLTCDNTTRVGEEVVEEDILDEGFKKDVSVLYISQLARGLVPFANFSNKKDGNIYQYVYDERPKYADADWDTGFNFFPKDEDDMVDWDMILKNGAYGNGFTMFGLYFPHSQQLTYQVKTDQSTLENLQTSNVLGAYHSTSSLYTRLRFRLFHLMVYLKVNLYVPVFQTGTDDQGRPTVSGFAADALQNAELLNIYPSFAITWTADRSSDTEAPLTAYTVAEEEQPVNIPMYMHPFPDGSSMPQKVRIPTMSFDPNRTDPEATDEVWMYTFSVVFPSQGATYGHNNFLRFNIRSNVGDVIKKYTFSGAQFVGTGVLNLNQGSKQQLDLYLPRNAGEAVLVNAQVIDWTYTNSNMHVSEDKNFED